MTSVYFSLFSGYSSLSAVFNINLFTWGSSLWSEATLKQNIVERGFIYGPTLRESTQLHLDADKSPEAASQDNKHTQRLRSINEDESCTIC